MNKYVILIPAYQPDGKLLTLLEQLDALALPVIAVNDGSTGASNDIFTHIAERYPQVHLLHHALNSGKGAALRTGFSYFLDHFPDTAPGIVTTDADGQHAPQDIIRVGEALLAAPESLALGTRVFSGDAVPLRSRLGNSITIAAFRLASGQRVSDTQTGLRGIPRDLAEDMLSAQESGFDFELEMLMRAAKSGRDISEVPIQTIYIDENASSHFNAVRDSARVYAVFWKHFFSRRKEIDCGSGK